MTVRRLPILPVLAALVAFAILIGLGTWQLQRRVWKQHILDRIAALQHAPARPLADVLAGAARGQEAEFARASTDCRPGPGGPSAYVYDLRGGRIAWRVLGVCPLASGMVVIDRGYAEASGSDTAPPSAVYSAPVHVEGVLRAPPRKTAVQDAASIGEKAGAGLQDRRAAVAWLERRSGLKAAPLVLVAEHETPPPAGVTPSAMPPDIPNRHLEYAITWYGLALALAGVCVALLRCRWKAQA